MDNPSLGTFLQNNVDAWQWVLGGAGLLIGIGAFLTYGLWELQLLRRNFPLDKLNPRWIGPALAVFVLLAVFHGLSLFVDLLLAGCLLFTVFMLLPQRVWKGFFSSGDDTGEVLEEVRRKAAETKRLKQGK